MLNTASAVEITAVRKTFGDVQALKGIDLNIAQGEFFGLLGPNGAGKSTLINIMAGLALADSGTVSIQGYDVKKDYRRARLSIGVVPQELVFDPFFSIRAFLRLQSGYFGLGPANYAWIDELIELLDLTEKADSTLRKLSGGMKRRVLIAQALVHRPPVVVLDEPTAGVDVELRQSLWRLIQRLHGEGHTIVLTTHYLEEAEALCDRIAIMYKGEVRALENKTALIARHPHRFVQMYLKNSDCVLPASVQSHVLNRAGQQVSFRLSKNKDSVGALLQTLLESGIQILDVETSAPSLEDVFLDIIAK